MRNYEADSSVEETSAQYFICGLFLVIAAIRRRPARRFSVIKAIYKNRSKNFIYKLATVEPYVPFINTLVLSLVVSTKPARVCFHDGLQQRYLW